MSELTIVTFKWRGWRGDDYYNSFHVNALASMLREHCSIPHKFICITDEPIGVEAETMTMWRDPGCDVRRRQPNSFRRLKLFSRHMAAVLGPRVLQIDLDCVILRDIAPLVTDDPFKIMHGKASKYNGSMWQVRPGALDYVWESFHKGAPQEIAKHEAKTKIRHYGSDQAWMSYKIDNAPTWDAKDGCHHFTLIQPNACGPGPANGRSRPSPMVPDNARVVFFAGGLKPWKPDMLVRNPELYEAYRRHMNVNFVTG